MLQCKHRGAKYETKRPVRLTTQKRGTALQQLHINHMIFFSPQSTPSNGSNWSMSLFQSP